MPSLSRAPARNFADQFRSARLTALADSESFDQIIHVVERLGSYLSKEDIGAKGLHGDLGKYRSRIVALVKSRDLAVESRLQFSHLLTPFETLYDLVKDARNDALHQGAFARHLTKHAIELAIILEDVLSNDLEPIVTDFMVRNPLCGEPWQPIAYLRQQMLANSYSFMPILGKDDQWRVVSDAAIARFLGPDRKGTERRKRLAMTIDDAAQLSENPVALNPAVIVDEKTFLDQAFELLKSSPILLVRSPAGTGVIGILTAFDLL
jgi:predicted transcriptional regulator